MESNKTTPLEHGKMRCHKCGKVIDDSTTVCPYCASRVGKALENPIMKKQPIENPIMKKQPKDPYPYATNSLAVIGFVFAFLIPIVGLICSIKARNQAYYYRGDGYGLATAGMIISIISMLVIVLSSIIVACSVASILR